MEPLTAYRPNVGAVLIRRQPELRILMAERLGEPGSWQFPQGGMDPGESHEQTLWRELHEELGLQQPQAQCRILGRGPALRYDFATQSPHVNAYRGQLQTLFVVEFLGSDQDIQLDAWEQPELERFEWISLAQVHERLYHVTRHIFEALLEAAPSPFGLAHASS